MVELTVLGLVLRNLRNTVKPIRAVVDTNVVLSALRSKLGASYRLMRLVGDPRWRMHNRRNCMSVLVVEIPDAVRAALDAAARRERKSPEQFASESLVRVAQAQKDLDYLAERAKRGRREDFDAFLSKVPDVPPSPGDEL
jgi:rRNA-processing protein FCF1